MGESLDSAALSQAKLKRASQRSQVKEGKSKKPSQRSRVKADLPTLSSQHFEKLTQENQLQEFRVRYEASGKWIDDVSKAHSKWHIFNLDRD